MITQFIRQQIAHARAHPHGADLLTRRLRELAGPAGASDEVALRQLVDQVSDYIDGAPDLLDACAQAAAQAGIGPYVAPLLQTAANYFTEPLDFIPDQHGLYGLLDDAYVVRSMLALISALYQQHTGVPLLPIDLHAQNQIVRVVIGEPLASRIDHAVHATVQQAIVQQQVAALAAQHQTLGVQASSRTGGPGSWGGTWEDEISRTAAECGISINW